jgi:hypothetical protein
LGCRGHGRTDQQTDNTQHLDGVGQNGAHGLARLHLPRLILLQEELAAPISRHVASRAADGAKADQAADAADATSAATAASGLVGEGARNAVALRGEHGRDASDQVAEIVGEIAVVTGRHRFERELPSSVPSGVSRRR